MLKRRIMIIGLLIISHLFWEIKAGEEIKDHLLTLQGSSNGKYFLIVKGKPPIKILMKKVPGIEINPKEWNQTKNGFAQDLDFTEIRFKLTNGWRFSGLRVRQSDDEESFLNENVLLTIRDIQQYATFYRRGKRTFNIMTFQHCYFRVRVLVEAPATKEKVFILEYVPETEALILYEEELGFPDDIIFN